MRSELLRLLKEDEEFRYAVAGLIGLGEVLKRLEEHDKKFAEILERLEEHDKKFCEILKRLEDRDKKFKEVLERLDRHEAELAKLREDMNMLREDMNKGFERHDRELIRLREDMQKGFERHDRELAKLREDMQKGFERHDKELARLREDMNKGFELLRRHIDALGARWGLMAEEAFREGLKGILEEELGLEVERWTSYDEEGTVYGHPSPVEIDVAIKDEKLILIEISSHVRASDVATFKRKAELYAKKMGRAPDKLLMITPFAEKEAIRLAGELDVEIYTKV